MRGHFHVDADVQVALTVALDVLDSFAAQSEQRSRLRASGDFNGGFVCERGYLNFRAERRLNKTHGHFAQQIVTVALENIVRLEMQHHVEIARWTAAQSTLAVARGAKS